VTPVAELSTPQVVVARAHSETKRPRRDLGQRAEQRAAALMLSPTICLIVVVAFLPVVYTLYLSFHNASVEHTGAFDGLANYRALAKDPHFRTAGLNTVIFTLVSVSLEFGIGLLAALALNRGFRARGIVRASVLVPWAFPVVISALMWRLMLQDQIGIVSYLAKTLGLGNGEILANQRSLMIASIVADVWKCTPFMTLLLLAGLQTVPTELTEAAMIDGTTTLQRFYRVTLPLLKPAILVALLFRTLEAWSVYDLFWVMTDRQLESLSTYVYKTVRISELNFGPGTAAAVLVFLSSIVIALVYMRILRGRSDDVRED
jgi:trehalose/maltose transport system permease protein